MSKAKRPTIKMTLPAGALLFPKLQHPDYKFDAVKGSYGGTIRLTSEEAAPIMERLTKFGEDEYAKIPAAVLKKLKKERKDFVKLPWSDPAIDRVPDPDDPDGARIEVEVPGFVDFRVSVKAYFEGKNGEKWPQKPIVFQFQRDGSGAPKQVPFTDELPMTGAYAQVGVTAMTYGGLNANINFGVTLRPVAVCVTEIRQRDVTQDFAFEPTVITGDVELEAPVPDVQGEKPVLEEDGLAALEL